MTITTTMSIPTIDISAPKCKTKIAQELTEACHKWGFALLKGHPIPSEDIEEMFSWGKDFFALPDEYKEAYPVTSKTIGYAGSFEDRFQNDKLSMWFGGLPGALAENVEMLDPFWRMRIGKVEAFKAKCAALVQTLLEYFVHALDLKGLKASAMVGAEVGVGNSLRMLLYPARAEDVAKSTEGSRMVQHTDSGTITLLFQRSSGLEIMSPDGDQWIQAPHEESCVLINIGDTLSFWSGRQLKATLHRVTFDSVARNQERQSMAYFGAATPDTVLKPLRSDPDPSPYIGNNIEIISGMTVGELNKRVMQDIYGDAVDARGNSLSDAQMT